MAGNEKHVVRILGTVAGRIQRHARRLEANSSSRCTATDYNEPGFSCELPGRHLFGLNTTTIDEVLPILTSFLQGIAEHEVAQANCGVWIQGE